VSFQLTNQVWKESRVPRDQKVALLVLLRMADRANEDDEAWPSVKSLAKDCRTTRVTVRAAIAVLEELGEVVRIAEAGERYAQAVFRVVPGGGSETTGVAQPPMVGQPCQGGGSAVRQGVADTPQTIKEPAVESPVTLSQPFPNLDQLRKAHSEARSRLQDQRFLEKTGDPSADVAAAKREVDRLAAAIRRDERGAAPGDRTGLGSGGPVIDQLIREFDAVELSAEEAGKYAGVPDFRVQT
jgi:hypothetical protein